MNASNVASLASIAFLATCVAAAAADDARDEWPRRIEEARERYDSFAALALANFESAAMSSAHGAPSEFVSLDDPTLRPGDIVVTATGLLLLEQAVSPVCEKNVFTPIAEARTSALPHARRIRAILRANFSRR